MLLFLYEDHTNFSYDCIFIAFLTYVITHYATLHIYWVLAFLHVIYSLNIEPIDHIYDTVSDSLFTPCTFWMVCMHIGYWFMI